MKPEAVSPDTEPLKGYEPRYRSIPAMLAQPHIWADVSLIKRSNKAQTPTRPGALEEKLTF